MLSLVGATDIHCTSNLHVIARNCNMDRTGTLVVPVVLGMDLGDPPASGFPCLFGSPSHCQLWNCFNFNWMDLHLLPRMCNRSKKSSWHNPGREMARDGAPLCSELEGTPFPTEQLTVPLPACRRARPGAAPSAASASALRAGDHVCAAMPPGAHGRPVGRRRGAAGGGGRLLRPGCPPAAGAAAAPVRRGALSRI